MFNLILKFPIFYLGISKFFNYNSWAHNFCNGYVYINLYVKNNYIKDTCNIYSNLIIKDFFNNIVKKSSVKTKAYINKSNKKPWAQKGLGRARAGSYSSPIWRGGGIIFGPIPGSVTFKIQIKELLKLRSYLFYNKRSNIYIFKCYNNFTYKNSINQDLKLIGINKLEKLLILENSFNKINAYDIIKHDYIIFII